nr:hypothetical protein [Tanacetum cinerariifolium]
MRTRSSSNLPVVSPFNPSTLNPKRQNRRRSKQPFILEESPVDTMADQRTMEELLRAPIGGAACRWLEKEPPRFIHTWEDLVSKYINEFFPPPQEQQIFVMKSPIFNNGLMNRFMRPGIDTKISIILFILKDSIDQSNLANPADNFVDSMPEMFTGEHALDYSSPPIFDEYDDDFLEVLFDTENVYDDPFDSKGKKNKESKLLIDELDLPCDFLPPFEYDSFVSPYFSRIDAKPSTNNENKVFNLGILIQEKPFEIITRVVQDKKLAISNASLVLEDFDPPSMNLFSSKKFPGLTCYSYFHLKMRKTLSNQGYTLLKKFILLLS